VEYPLADLFGVSILAFSVPFALGFFPWVRIPAIAVEIIAGILVGPAVLGWLDVSDAVGVTSVLGVAFLLFLAGLELDVRAIRGDPLRLGAIGFGLSLAIAVAGAVPLWATGVVLAPVLVAVALCSTSVGIVVPVLRDTGNLRSAVGTYTVAGGAAAEFGGIVLLGLFFASPVGSVGEEIVVLLLGSVTLVVLGVVIAAVLWLASRALRWRPGRAVARRLDETSSQLGTRAAVMLVLGMAVVAAAFGYEVILGTFIAGIFVGTLIRGDPREHVFRTRLDAMGFGFFVPVFFVASGMRLDVAGLLSAEELLRIGIFTVLLLLARGLPAALYRRRLGGRWTIAAGLMQATNLSFVVVAVAVGLQTGMMLPITGSALVMAGLLSAILFPAIAQSLLGRVAPQAEAARALTSA
jgi:Kef-type K+ transport system membrane component KefB